MVIFQFILRYFFIISLSFFYGKLFNGILKKYIITHYKFIGVYIIKFKEILNYDNLIFFILWLIGFISFVLSLKKGSYKYQISLFAWIHLCIILIVAQCSVIIINLYEGMIWMIMPAMLVITNDIFAYIFGRLFGKT